MSSPIGIPFITTDPAQWGNCSPSVRINVPRALRKSAAYLNNISAAPRIVFAGKSTLGIINDIAQPLHSGDYFEPKWLIPANTISAGWLIALRVWGAFLTP